MHRNELKARLAPYRRQWPDESETVARFEAFVDSHPDCFHRSCRVGHITGSAWIVNRTGERVLLTHHRKLGRWLRTALVRRPKLDEFAGLIEHWLGDGRRHGCGKIRRGREQHPETAQPAQPHGADTCVLPSLSVGAPPRRLWVILTQYCRIKSAVLWFVGGSHALVAVDRQDSGIKCKRRHEGSLMTNKPWVSVDDLAKHLGVAKYSVYRWIDHKRLPGSQDWTTVERQAIGGR